MFFSGVFPLAKTLTAAIIFRQGARPSPKLASLLNILGKWSMLDVFLVAVMILVLEGSVLTTSDVHLGLFLFAGAVVLSTYGARRVSLVLEQIRES